MDTLAYKERTDIIEESQQLLYCIELLNNGFYIKVDITDDILTKINNKFKINITRGVYNGMEILKTN